MGELKKLILIDGNAIMHRAYHALPPLSTKKGELVNAVYGFASTMLSVIENLKPDYIAASFDLAGPTFRHEEYKEYKATRTKAPDEFYRQIPRVKEFVKDFNIPIFEKEGYEADDVIGTLTKQAEKNEGIKVVIVTGDLDTLQLVSDKTSIYTMRKGLSDSVIYDEEKVRARYNLEPIQIIDYKGLRGDPSDNIPGVKGIGEKIATELLIKYGTVEKIYQSLAEIKDSIKEKLERDRLKAFMSKKLATISTEVPVKLDLEKTKVHDFDREKLVNLFKELNFYSLIKRIPETTNNNESNPMATNNLETGEIKDFKYTEVDGQNAEDFWKEISEQKEISLAVDALGENSQPEIKGMAFSWKAGRAFYVKYSEEKFEQMRAILENEKIKKIGYDLKKTLKIFNAYNIKLIGISFDDMIAAYVLDPGVKIEFEKLVLEDLGEEISREKNKSGQLSMMVDEGVKKNVIEEVCQEADYVLKMKNVLAEKISAISEEQKADKYVSEDLQKLFFEVEMPLVEILSKMEIQGIKLNTIIFSGISEKINSKIKNIEENIYSLSGSSFNINSPQQLSEVLFKKIKLPTLDIKKNKTGYSTASSELDKLHSKHKIIEKIEEYRELFKLKTTYLDVLPGLVDENSRLHTTFNQAVTATGRLSSADPNMQNIPIKTEIGQLMRTAFVAEDGYRMISGDYSQIDLRVVAHVSDDKKLIEAFVRGDDIHKITAAEINKVTLSQVTDKMRRAAKALNFGVIYGMSVFGFSKASGIERDDAKKFIDEYMKKFSGVANYIMRTKEFAKRTGFVETLLGRRRNISEINSPNFQVAQGAERMAINMPIQGLSADIVKLAMVKISEEYQDNPNVRMTLQIHDEIMLEAKEEIAEDVGRRVKEIMESVFKLKVPLVAEVHSGDNWGEI